MQKTETTIPAEVLRDRVNTAIDLAFNGLMTDGGHHKQWYLDQIIQTLASERYRRLCKEAKNGEEGPETYDWEEGIAP